jgi:hypothetical protein
MRTTTSHLQRRLESHRSKILGQRAMAGLQ